MSSTRTVRSLGVEAPGRCYFFEYEEGPPADGQFRLDTMYTGLSAGTELTFVKGTNPYLHASWDAEYGMFRPGEPAARYPVPFLGYMEVGRVTESRTPAVRDGQVVAMSYGHKTGHTAGAGDFFVPVPDGIDPLLGVYLAQMGPICANGLLTAAAELVGPDADDLGAGVRGRHVLVTGAGVIGLIIGLWAKHLGAAGVAIIDRTPPRLVAAAALGLEVFLEGAADAALKCKELWHHGPNDRGADVVFQCRGQSAALQTALRSLRPQGCVIDLAFYQGGAPEVRLGEEFHHNWLSVRCAQIGRVPRGLERRWDKRRLADETVALMRAHGPLIRQHLVTDVVPFADAPAFVAELAERKRQTIQAVFAVTP